jgi:hypothetical protein
MPTADFSIVGMPMDVSRKGSCAITSSNGFMVEGAGRGYRSGATGDSATYVYTYGDNLTAQKLVVKVDSQRVDGVGQAGVTMRYNPVLDDAHATVLRTSDGKVMFVTRDHSSTNDTQYVSGISGPVWLQVRKQSGPVLTGWYSQVNTGSGQSPSTNPAHWTQIGSEREFLYLGGSGFGYGLTVANTGRKMNKAYFEGFEPYFTDDDD